MVVSTAACGPNSSGAVSLVPRFVHESVHHIHPTSVPTRGLALQVIQAARSSPELAMELNGCNASRPLRRDTCCRDCCGRRRRPSPSATRSAASSLVRRRTVACAKNRELQQLRADVPALVRLINELTLENHRLRDALAQHDDVVVAFRPKVCLDNVVISSPRLGSGWRPGTLRRRHCSGAMLRTAPGTAVGRVSS